MPDPYCYPGSTVLKNIPDLRDQNALDAFEAVSTAQRSDEALPNGRLSVTHYCAVHRHLFQDVYRWAGRFRTVRISKDGNMFCFPEHIRREMRNLFSGLRAQGYLRDRTPDDFAMGAADFLAQLNAIHPFRDGNGRAQVAFMALLAHQASQELRFDRLEPDDFLAAMITSFGGHNTPLTAQLRLLMT